MALISAAFFMMSCAVSASSAQGENDWDGKPVKETAATCFVILKDGTRHYYHTLRLVTGVFTSPHLLGDGHTKIAASSITAYQDEENYAVSQEGFINGRKSKVAVDVLPGFAVRIAQGKLNIYSKKYYNGAGTSEELYIQSGPDGAIIAYTPELLNTLLRGHSGAFNFFNSRKNMAPVSKKLQATAELYNREEMLSKN